MTETAPVGRPAPADGTYPTTSWKCSTCCGALATVRDGRVVDFAPSRDHPYSKGAFCIKGIRGAPGITYGAGRLLHLLRRTGARRGRGAHLLGRGRFDEMADRLAQVRQKYGAEGDRRRHQRRLLLAQPDPRSDLRSIGSPNWMINQDLCGDAGR
jgi:anaerobic selenocysteine-containing dehydrogenase